MLLSHPNGQQQEVILREVPRVGEQIRLRNGKPGTTPVLLVTGVLWMEATNRGDEPTVVVTVRPRDVP